MLVLGLSIAFLYFFVNPTQVQFFPKCPLYSYTGIYCPGCGSQRATHQLLNFNFFGVLHQNLLYVIGLFVLAYYVVITILQLVFKKPVTNYLDNKKVLWFFVFVIVIFWIARNLPWYPFTLLAPTAH